MKQFFKEWVIPILLILTVIGSVIKCSYDSGLKDKEIRELKQQRNDD